MNLIEGHQPITSHTGIPALDVDPYDPEILKAPNSYYAAIRDAGPVVYIPQYSILATGRYEETKTIFSDWERFVSSRGVGLDDFHYADAWRPPSIILEVDPPDHTRTRKVMARALSPKAIAALKDMFFAEAERLIDRLLEQGSFEAIENFAEVFPTTVFPRAVGMKETDPRRLVDYGAMVFNGIGPDNDLRRQAMAKGADIVPWINAACARDKLEQSGIGAEIYAAADSGEITSDEAGMLVRSLLSAGVDTTVTGIGSALWCLATNPDAFEMLQQTPKLARPCFEEVLRYTSPVHSFCRTANQDTQVSGTDIPEGAKILCVLGAANLDERKWLDPLQFKIDRKPAGHLGLGTGVHGCVGQNIARAELEAVLTVLAEKVARIELAGEAIWRPNNAIHALDKLPLKLVKG